MLTAGAVVLPEATWRADSAAHSARMRSLLSPGFVAATDHLTRDRKPSRRFPRAADGWLALDPEHPVYNFMLEYYALKGAKATRRLGRWSPTLSPNGVLLQGATEADLESGCLSPRGAKVSSRGVAYDPRAFQATATRGQCASFLWYRSVLAATLDATPVLHCYGLHEWAMQYQPEGAPPPPSAQYQKHLPLRVSRAQINQAVERRGISCTHVDALRYFAPAAGPLNRHGATLRREQQTMLEQPGCVHAHMDLLKIALKLHPWLPAVLVGDALEIAIAARELDVAASPYDLRAHGIAPVCIETEEGRLEYRQRQEELMQRAQPVRRRLLDAYDTFIAAGFKSEALTAAVAQPNAVHFADATPGGPAWRWSLASVIAELPPA